MVKFRKGLQWICALCVPLLGCISQSPVRGLTDFPITETAEWIDISGDEVVPLCHEIVIGDSVIYMLAQMDGYQVQVFDRYSGKLIRQMVRIGSGPGETVDAWHFNVFEQDSALVIFDGSTRSMNYYNLRKNGTSEFIRSENWMIDLDHIFEVGPIYNELLPLRNGRVLADGRNTKQNSFRRLFILNDGRKEICRYDSVPDDYVFHRLTEVHHVLHSVAVSPDERHFAFVTTYGALFEIYDITDSTIVQRMSERCFPMNDEYLNMTYEELSRASALSGADPVRAFRNATATNKYIAGAYSGEHASKDFSATFRKIGIWDWEGNPIKTIITDRWIVDLAFSPDGKELYCVGQPENGDVSLARLPLNIP